MSDTESTIRAIKLARISGQDRWPFSDDDIEEILEALQLKADLEVIFKAMELSTSIFPPECCATTGKPKWCVMSGRHRPGSNFVSGVGETLTDAIQAAAEAIRKGGE